jgi:hypothetical protein
LKNTDRDGELALQYKLLTVDELCRRKGWSLLFKVVDGGLGFELRAYTFSPFL